MNTTEPKAKPEVSYGKKKLGRPITVDYKNDRQYFTKYYEKTNIEKTCTCGSIIFHRQMNKHLKTPRHARLKSILDNKIKQEKEEADRIMLEEVILKKEEKDKRDQEFLEEYYSLVRAKPVSWWER